MTQVEVRLKPGKHVQYDGEICTGKQTVDEETAQHWGAMGWLAGPGATPEVADPEVHGMDYQSRVTEPEAGEDAGTEGEDAGEAPSEEPAEDPGEASPWGELDEATAAILDAQGITPEMVPTLTDEQLTVPGKIGAGRIEKIRQHFPAVENPSEQPPTDSEGNESD